MKHQPKSMSPSLSILEKAGIPMNDPAGWLLHGNTSKSKIKCGAAMLGYFNARDADAEAFFDKLDRQLREYRIRVETVESYVYMQCVGIQLEKHFSKERANALAAFEKKATHKHFKIGSVLSSQVLSIFIRNFLKIELNCSRICIALSNDL